MFKMENLAMDNYIELMSAAMYDSELYLEMSRRYSEETLELELKEGDWFKLEQAVNQRLVRVLEGHDTYEIQKWVDILAGIRAFRRKIADVFEIQIKIYERGELLAGCKTNDAKTAFKSLLGCMITRTGPIRLESMNGNEKEGDIIAAVMSAYHMIDVKYLRADSAWGIFGNDRE